MNPYRLYADSAVEPEVARLLETGLVEGVTTNPTILLRSGQGPRDIPRLHQAWRDLGASRMFFQAWGADAASMLACARELAALGEDVSVKVPATSAGFTVGRRLAAEGTPVLVTAVYTPAQAIAASAIGAEFIAPYLGRLVDAGHDGTALIGRMNELLSGTSTSVLAASLRSPSAVVGLAEQGVRAFTAAPAVLWELLRSDESESTAQAFEQDIAMAEASENRTRTSP